MNDHPTRQQRIEWLLEHQDLWVGVEPFHGQTLLKQMRMDGLYSITTALSVINIETLLDDARREL